LTAAAAHSSIGAPSAAQTINVGYDPFGREVTLQVGSHIVKQITRRALTTQTQDEWDIAQNLSHTTVVNGFGELDSTSEPTAVAGDALITSYQRNVESQTIETVYYHSGGTDYTQQVTEYDSLGRPIFRSDSNAGTGFNYGWRYLWDTNSNLVGTSDPRGCGENFYYDAAKRMVAEDYSPCQANHTAYSPIVTFGGTPTGDNAEVFYRYDSYESGQLAPESTFDDRSSYARRRLTAVEDRGSHTRFNYDARGHVRRVSRQMAKQITAPLVADRYTTHWYDVLSSYDNGDRLVAQKGRSYEPTFTYNGEADEWFTYNARGQLATRGFGGTAGPSHTLVTGVTYDADGLANTVHHGDGSNITESMTYDASLRTMTGYNVSRASPPSFWGSPPAGYSSPPAEQKFLLLISQIISYGPGGTPTDVLSGNTTLSWTGGAAPVKTTHYDYWPDQRLKAVTRTFNTGTNGQAWKSPHAAETSGGDHTPFPAQTNATTRSTSQTFDYDWLGNTTNTTDDKNLFWDRSLGTITNGFDGDGNQIGPNQIGMANRNLFVSYDWAGNVVSERLERDGTCDFNLCVQRTDFVWDEVNQLSSAARYDYAGSTMPASEPAYPAAPTITPAVQMYFEYSEGGRVRKSTKTGTGTVHDLDVSSMQRLHGVVYHNDIAEYVATEDNQISYLSGGEQIIHDATLPTITPGNAQHVLMTFGDRMGSSSVAVDYETAEVAERVDFLAYGQVEGDSRYPRWKNKFNQFNLTGKEEDRELGLHYFGARYYSSNLGRWMSLDPLVIHGGMVDANPYAYVSGKPSRMVDPSGLDPGDISPSASASSGFQVEQLGDPKTESVMELSDLNAAPQDTSPRDPAGDAWWVSAGNGINEVNRTLSGMGPGMDLAEHAITAVQNGNGWDYTKQFALSGLGATGDVARYAAPEMAPRSGDGAKGANDGIRITFEVALVAIPLLKAANTTREIGTGAKLARALTEARIPKPPGPVPAAAHHIVAGNAKAAARAQAVLRAFGIGINSAENGVWLPQSVHEGMHTGAYYKEVNRLLAQATSRAEAIEALDAIREGILNGTFP